MRVMRTTTEEITRSWLLPEMVSRVASMLDYFLDHLAGGHYSELRPLPGHHLQAGHDAHTEQPVTDIKSAAVIFHAGDTMSPSSRGQASSGCYDRVSSLA